DPGRHRLESQPSSRTGENPPYGMIGRIEETSASFEARSAPRSYPSPITGPSFHYLTLEAPLDSWLHGADRANDQNDQEAQCLLTENVTMKLGKPGSRPAQLIVSDQ